MGQPDERFAGKQLIVKAVGAVQLRQYVHIACVGLELLGIIFAIAAAYVHRLHLSIQSDLHVHLHMNRKITEHLPVDTALAWSQDHLGDIVDVGQDSIVVPHAPLNDAFHSMTFCATTFLCTALLLAPVQRFVLLCARHVYFGNADLRRRTYRVRPGFVLLFVVLAFYPNAFAAMGLKLLHYLKLHYDADAAFHILTKPLWACRHPLLMHASDYALYGGFFVSGLLYMLFLLDMQVPLGDKPAEVEAVNVTGAGTASGNRHLLGVWERLPQTNYMRLPVYAKDCVMEQKQVKLYLHVEKTDSMLPGLKSWQWEVTRMPWKSPEIEVSIPPTELLFRELGAINVQGFAGEFVTMNGEYSSRALLHAGTPNAAQSYGQVVYRKTTPINELAFSVFPVGGFPKNYLKVERIPDQAFKFNGMGQCVMLNSTAAHNQVYTWVSSCTADGPGDLREGCPYVVKGIGSRPGDKKVGLRHLDVLLRGCARAEGYREGEAVRFISTIQGSNQDDRTTMLCGEGFVLETVERRARAASDEGAGAIMGAMKSMAMAATKSMAAGVGAQQAEEVLDAPPEVPAPMDCVMVRMTWGHPDTSVKFGDDAEALLVTEYLAPCTALTLNGMVHQTFEQGGKLGKSLLGGLGLKQACIAATTTGTSVRVYAPMTDQAPIRPRETSGSKAFDAESTIAATRPLGFEGNVSLDGLAKGTYAAGSKVEEVRIQAILGASVSGMITTKIECPAPFEQNVVLMLTIKDLQLHVSAKDKVDLVVLLEVSTIKEEQERFSKLVSKNLGVYVKNFQYADQSDTKLKYSGMQSLLKGKLTVMQVGKLPDDDKTTKLVLRPTSSYTVRLLRENLELGYGAAMVSLPPSTWNKLEISGVAMEGVITAAHKFQEGAVDNNATPGYTTPLQAGDVSCSMSVHYGRHDHSLDEDAYELLIFKSQPDGKAAKRAQQIQTSSFKVRTIMEFQKVRLGGVPVYNQEKQLPVETTLKEPGAKTGNKSFMVDSIAGFAPGDAIMVGDKRHQISSLGTRSTSINLVNALAKDHPTGTAVTLIQAEAWSTFWFLQLGEKLTIECNEPSRERGKKRKAQELVRMPGHRLRPGSLIYCCRDEPQSKSEPHNLLDVQVKDPSYGKMVTFAREDVEDGGERGDDIRSIIFQVRDVLEGDLVELEDYGQHDSGRPAGKREQKHTVKMIEHLRQTSYLVWEVTAYGRFQSRFKGPQHTEMPEQDEEESRTSFNVDLLHGQFDTTKPLRMLCEQGVMAQIEVDMKNMPRPKNASLKPLSGTVKTERKMLTMVHLDVGPPKSVITISGLGTVDGTTTSTPVSVQQTAGSFVESGTVRLRLEEGSEIRGSIAGVGLQPLSSVSLADSGTDDKKLEGLLIPTKDDHEGQKKWYQKRQERLKEGLQAMPDVNGRPPRYHTVGIITQGRYNSAGHKMGFDVTTLARGNDITGLTGDVWSVEGTVDEAGEMEFVEDDSLHFFRKAQVLWKPHVGNAWDNMNSVFGVMTLKDTAVMVVDVALDFNTVYIYYSMGLYFFMAAGTSMIIVPSICTWGLLYSVGVMKLHDIIFSLTQTGCFKEMYEQLKAGERTNNLVWIILGEACLESAPQSILQSYCLLLDFSQLVKGSTSLYFSIVWSCFNVSKTLALIDYYGHTGIGVIHRNIRICVRFFEVTSRVSSLALFGSLFRAENAGIHSNTQRALPLLLAMDCMMVTLLVWFYCPKGGTMNFFWGMAGVVAAPPGFNKPFRRMQCAYYALRLAELVTMLLLCMHFTDFEARVVNTTKKSMLFFLRVMFYSTLTFYLIAFVSALESLLCQVCNPRRHKQRRQHPTLSITYCIAPWAFDLWVFDGTCCRRRLKKPSAGSAASAGTLALCCMPEKEKYLAIAVSDPDLMEVRATDGDDDFVAEKSMGPSQSMTKDLETQKLAQTVNRKNVADKQAQMLWQKLSLPAEQRVPVRKAAPPAAQGGSRPGAPAAEGDEPSDAKSSDPLLSEGGGGGEVGGEENGGSSEDQKKEEGDELLFDAVRQRDLMLCRVFAVGRSGPLTKVRTDTGHTTFHLACLSGKMNLVDILESTGHDTSPSAKTKEGYHLMAEGTASELQGESSTTSTRPWAEVVKPLGPAPFTPADYARAYRPKLAQELGFGDGEVPKDVVGPAPQIREEKRLRSDAFEQELQPGETAYRRKLKVADAEESKKSVGHRIIANLDFPTEPAAWKRPKSSLASFQDGTTGDFRGIHEGCSLPLHIAAAIGDRGAFDEIVQPLLEDETLIEEVRDLRDSLGRTALDYVLRYASCDTLPSQATSASGSDRHRGSYRLLPRLMQLRVPLSGTTVRFHPRLLDHELLAEIIGCLAFYPVLDSERDVDVEPNLEGWTLDFSRFNRDGTDAELLHDLTEALKARVSSSLTLPSTLILSKTLATRPDIGKLVATLKMKKTHRMVLDLSQTKVADEGCVELGAYLKGFKELHLCGCGITDAGAESLAEGLKDLGEKDCLEVLDLRSNLLSEKGMQHLLLALGPSKGGAVGILRLVGNDPELPNRPRLSGARPSYKLARIWKAAVTENPKLTPVLRQKVDILQGSF
eukprot:TRINITY_DN120740_c0_g1_i1.p1 TRINITY_DN120740_c0_g1~~TRINITY_DN120740_c0_g1_i1.p1  ORF type:complete len:2879 (+),score=626.86 TRINITY_DN120740_c0_g1_i1:950-8638(+)